MPTTAPPPPPPPAPAPTGGPDLSTPRHGTAAAAAEPAEAGATGTRGAGRTPGVDSSTSSSLRQVSRSSHSESSLGDNGDDDTQSFDMLEESDFDDDDSSSSSSSTSDGPRRAVVDSTIAAGAPTPFNTMFDEYAYADPGPQASYVSYNDRDMSTDMTGPTITNPNDTLPSSTSRGRKFLTPADDYIPQSTRPIPPPPQIRTDPVDNHLSPTHSSSADSHLNKTSVSDDGRRNNPFSNRFRRKQPPLEPDALRLQQLGYDAVLGRGYTFWSSLGIAFMNIGTIQGAVFAVPGSYKYGGPAMMLVAWPISGILSLALVSTLSELASAYPVAGGMASWAWKCARAGVRGERYWGWVMGAIVLGAHIGSLILVSSQATSVIAGTMGLAFDYHPERWQMVLWFLAIVVAVGSFGSTSFGASGRYWVGAGSFGFCLWLAICITLAATGISRRDFSNSPPISTHFTTTTGWTSRGYVYLLGWQYCTIAIGADVCAHMSEETQSPSRNVPKAMTLGVVLTYLLAYIMIIIFFLSVNPEDAEFLATQPFPVGHILAKAISHRGAITLCVLIVIAMCIQLQAQLQAASRFMFAMARDRALPFSDQIKRTSKKKQPFVATWICVGLWAPFSCLLISSATVIYSVVTVGTATLGIVGYFVPVALYLASKLDLRVEGRSSWSLGRLSRPVAAIGALFCTTIIVVLFLPSKRPVQADNMSWSPVIMACTLLISAITWKTYGERHYSGPIRAVTKWETGMEIDLDSTLQASTARAARSDSGSTSLKLAVTPCYDTTVPTVQVASARTAETNMSMGEWQHASFTTDGTSTAMSPPRTHGTATMGRVDEESVDVEVGAPDGDGDYELDDLDDEGHHFQQPLPRR